MLWARGPSTVRQVHDVLSANRDFAYTTTLKLLQLMTEKGVAVREEDGRVHLYRAAVAQEETQRHLIRDLLDRAFGGSPSAARDAGACREAGIARRTEGNPPVAEGVRGEGSWLTRGSTRRWFNQSAGRCCNFVWQGAPSARHCASAAGTSSDAGQRAVSRGLLGLALMILAPASSVLAYRGPTIPLESAALAASPKSW